MATLVGDLLVKLSASDNELTATLARAGQKMQGFGDKMKEVGQSMSMYLTAPMVLAGGASIKMASDLSENLNKVGVVFKGIEKDIEAWSKTTLKASGIAQSSALEMISVFGAMAKSMGQTQNGASEMGKELVKRTGDMASFYNVSQDVAQTALKGIFTGEGEALKQFGVVMLDSELKAYALANGIKTSYEKMSQAEKVALRYKFVMEKTAISANDFTNTSGGAANQTRIFGEQMKELGASFGQVILPLFTKILTAVNGWIEKFKGLDDSTKKVILVVAGLAAVLGPLFLAIGFFTSNVLPLLTVGFASLAPILLPLTAIIAGLAIAYKAFNAEASRTADEVERLNKASLEQLEIQKTAIEAKIRERAAQNKLTDSFALNMQIVDQALGGGFVTGLRKLAGGSTELEDLLTKYRAINIAIQNRKKAQEEANKVTSVAPNVEIAKTAVVTEKTIGLINNLEKEIADLGKKQREALNPEDVKKYGDRIEELQNRVERLKKGRPATGQDLGDAIAPIKGLPAKVNIPVTLEPKVDTSAFEETKMAIIEIGDAMRALATNAAVSFGESIGNAIAGGGGLKSVLDGMLTMLADWASQFGQTLIAAGTATLIAQKALAANPALAIGAGIALVAAAAAVKASASKPVMGGSSGSSSGTGTAGRGSIEGYRTMREDFVVNVNGTLTGKGSDLVAVINKEGTRKSL